MYKKLIALVLTSLCAVNTQAYVPNLVLWLANVASGAYVYEKGVRSFVTSGETAYGQNGSSFSCRIATPEERNILTDEHPLDDGVKLYISADVGVSGGCTDSKNWIILPAYVFYEGKVYSTSGAFANRNSLLPWVRQRSNEIINRLRATIGHERGHINDDVHTKTQYGVPLVAAGTAVSAAVAERAIWGPLYLSQKGGAILRKAKHFGKSLMRCALRIPGAYAVYGLAYAGMYGLARYYEYSADDQIDIKYVPAFIAGFKEFSKQYSDEKCDADYTQRAFPNAQKFVKEYAPSYEKQLNKFCGTWLSDHPSRQARLARAEKRLRNAQRIQTPFMQYGPIMEKPSQADCMTMLERGETADGLSFNVYQELLEAEQQGARVFKKNYKPLKLKNLVEAV